MKIFLVWSGERSFHIAKALYEWLPRIIQSVKPFFSNEIDKGAAWADKISEALEGTHFGIVCLTPDNLDSNWIHYETGALSKTEKALIWTYLSDLNNGNVSPPLGKFQHTQANKEDTLKLLKTINRHLPDAGGELLSEQILEESFELRWDDLEKQLEAASHHAPGSQKPVQRLPEAMFEEILELLRSQQRQLSILPKRITSVSFTIPEEIEGKDGKIGYISLAEKVSAIFQPFNGTTKLDWVGTEGLITIFFSPPADRATVTKMFDIAEHAIGWRPSPITLMKT